MVSNLCSNSSQSMPTRSFDALSMIGRLNGRKYTVLVEGEFDTQFWDIFLSRYFKKDRELFQIFPCGDKDRALKIFLKNKDEDKFILIIDSDYDHNAFSGKHHKELYQGLEKHTCVVKTYGYNAENYLTNLELIHKLIQNGFKYKEVSLGELNEIANTMFDGVIDLVLFDAFFVRNNRTNFPSRDLPAMLKKSFIRGKPYICKKRIGELIHDWCEEQNDGLIGQDLYEAVSKYINYQKKKGHLTRQNINGKLVMNVLLGKLLREHTKIKHNYKSIEEALYALLTKMCELDVEQLPNSFQHTIHRINQAFEVLRESYPVNINKVQLS